MLLLLLGEDLDMARRVHVGVDSTMSSVSSSSALLSGVALNVGKDKLISVEALGFGVTNAVLEDLDNNLGGLNRPATLSVLELLSLGSSANTTIESSEGNTSVLLDDGMEVLHSIPHSGTTDGSADLEGILEVDTDISALSLAS
jgi:hypothetical protein